MSGSVGEASNGTYGAPHGLRSAGSSAALAGAGLTWGPQQRSASVAVYGARSLVGRELVRSLLDVGHPRTLLRLFDDDPRPLSYRDEPLAVQPLPNAPHPTQLAFIARGGPVARSLCQRLVDSGVRVVDLSEEPGLDPDAPVLTRGLEGGGVGAFTPSVRAIRGPLAWLAPMLDALGRTSGLREVVATWLAPAAAEGLEALLQRRGAEGGVVGTPGGSPNGSLFAGIALEGRFDATLLRRLLGVSGLAVELSTVRGVALRADVVQVHLRCARDVELDEALEALARVPGIRVHDPAEGTGSAVGARSVEGRGGVEVVRLRAGVRGSGSLSFLGIGDHLLAGAVRSALFAASRLPLG